MSGSAEQKTLADISYLHRKGTGSTMLLLHGIGSNARAFDTLISKLPDNLNIIAWNAPGYENSAPLATPWPTEIDYADKLKQLLDALELKNCIILGHSLGTLIAAKFAQQYPEHVSLLILASSACGYAATPNSELPAKAQNRLDDLDTLGKDAFAKARASNLVFQPELNPSVVFQVERGMSQINRQGYAQATRMLASGNLEESLRHVSTPTHFIIGINDRITPESQTLAAAKAFESANEIKPVISRIENAGHAVYQQQPDAFASIVTKVIEENNHA